MQYPIRFLFFIGLFAFIFSCKNDEKPKPSLGTQGIDPIIENLTTQIVGGASNDTLYYRRAEAYYQAEGYDEAIADLQRAIAIDSMKAPYHHLLADTYLDYYKSYPAILTMEKAVKLFPDRIPTLLKMSEFYLIVEKHGDALKTIDAILQRDPQNAEAFFMTGMVAKDMKDTTRAIKAFEKSVAMEPNNYDAWIILGNLLLEKNSKVCLNYFDNAIRIDSLNPAAYDGKATYYHKNGRMANAVNSYQDIVRVQPQRAETFFDIGLIYLEIDSFQQAKQHFDLAITNDRLFFKAFYYRGLAYESLGDLEAARKDYKEAKSMVSGFTEAEEAFERLSK